ncbi:hypothetical protein DL98DRAFT_604462 [Cadophora sp. DSE1049]|nr:hypothetical protein DL98DRAFT_604462 [Cadophora sp. DSE1049]
MATKNAVQYFDSGALSYEELTGGCKRELARYVVQLSLEIAPGSTILDNACRPAVVSEEILRTIPRHTGPPAISAVDATPAVIELGRSKPDLTVHESIYRTLKPGGTAIVTTWADLGYLSIVRKAQAASWFSGDHLERVLRDGGFTKIDFLEKEVHMCAPSLTGVVDILFKAFYSVCEDWSREEQARFKSHLLHFAQPTAKTLHRGEGASSRMEQVGIPMTAIVAIARK